MEMKTLYKLGFTLFVIFFFNKTILALPINAFIDNVTPDVNAVNVSKSSDVMVVFTQNMNASTINSDNIKLFGYQTGLLSTSINYNAVTKTATINPGTDFKIGETIGVTLTPGIQTASNTPITPFTYTFTVQAIGGSGHFTQGQILNSFANYDQLESGDIDNDGDLDIIALFLRLDSLGIRVYKNDGNANFILSSNINRAGPFLLADFDNDNDPDIVLYEFPSLYLYKNNGNGTFIETSSFPLSLFHAQLGDFNGDGYIDIASAFVFGTSIINNVNGVFSLNTNYPANDSCNYDNKEIDNQLVRDFNRDGALDILDIYYSFDDIFAHNTCRYFLTLQNTGSGSFNYDYFYNDNFFAHPGIIVGSQAFNSENNGNINIYSPHKKFTGGSISSFPKLTFMHAADFNGDGNVDLTGSFLDSNLNLYISMNDGSGIFSTFSNTNISYSPYFYGFTSGDFDNDGDIDIAADNTIYLNTDGPMPVELSSFIAKVRDRNVLLNWTTTSEENNFGFNVERSMVNGQWSVIGFVQGSGTTSLPREYEFSDRNLFPGKYKYRLKQIDYNGNFKYYDLLNEVTIGIPNKFNLSQNYPNPFNPTTKINFDIPSKVKGETSNVKLVIYDITGKEIAVLVNESLEPGSFEVTFDGSNFSSGIYFYKIQANNFSETRRMILLK